MTQPMSFPAHPVLILDDDPPILLASETILRAGGINHIITMSDSRELLPYLARNTISVLLLDLTMPYISGEELLRTVSQDYPEIHTIVITSKNQVRDAVECMRSGAFDYLVKPTEGARLVTSVKRAIEHYELDRDNDMLRHSMLQLEENLKHPEAFAGLITQNKTMQSIFHYIEAFSASSRPVLITGETGVGKELFARAVHVTSRRTGPFVAVTLAGLDETMISDTLFGHAKGAYTGADEERSGLVAQAQGGTLFLDEIGDLREASQIKLLRLLQEHEYMPIGSDRLMRSSARIVVATHRDLKALMQRGVFRHDLFYRLRTHHVVIPPLRTRKEDIPLLLEHFVQKAVISLECRKPAIPHGLSELLQQHDFPGNVRELETMVFDAVSHSQSGRLSLEWFAGQIHSTVDLAALPTPAETAPNAAPLTVGAAFPTLKQATDLLVEEALKRSAGNQRIAARLLGISPPALSKRLKNRKE